MARPSRRPFCCFNPYPAARPCALAEDRFLPVSARPLPNPRAQSQFCAACLIHPVFGQFRRAPRPYPLRPCSPIVPLLRSLGADSRRDSGPRALQRKRVSPCLRADKGHTVRSRPLLGFSTSQNPCMRKQRHKAQESPLVAFAHSFAPVAAHMSSLQRTARAGKMVS
jgi:hypothetical protein